MGEKIFLASSPNFSCFNLNLSCFNLHTLSLILPSCTTVKSLAPSSWWPPYRYWRMLLLRPLKLSVLQTEQAWIPQTCVLQLLTVFVALLWTSSSLPKSFSLSPGVEGKTRHGCRHCLESAKRGETIISLNFLPIPLFIQPKNHRPTEC